MTDKKNFQLVIHYRIQEVHKIKKIKIDTKPPKKINT